MTSSTVPANLTEIAAFWRTSRRLYTIYAELKRTFEIDLQLCKDLEYPIDRSEPEVIERVRQWFDQMDARVHVWQLRQLLQSTNLQTEENLRELIHRHLSKPQKTEIDRDKIDFLLVQYFAHCAPHGLYEQQITMEEVGRVLKPVLGEVPENFPEWSGGLDGKLDVLNQCNSLEQLQNSGALLEVRELKLSLTENYFDAGGLVAFTRFNFLARRAFFRAMHLDLHAIRNAINELETRGFTTVDCREAGMSEQESLETIRHLVHQWKTPFRAPYSGGSSFLQLIVLRHVLQYALDRSSGKESAAAAPAAAFKQAEEMRLVAPPEPPRGEPFRAPAMAPQPAQMQAFRNVAPQPPQMSDRGSQASPAAPAEDAGYLEQCITDLTQQLSNAPPKKGASVTPIVLGGCRLLIATWEAEAFTKTDSEFHRGLQRVVAARTILHVCVERHKKKEATDLFAALEIAQVAVQEIRQDVATAKEKNDIDAAVNLAATAKRLISLIEQAEKLATQ